MNALPNPYLITGPALISFSGGRTSGYMLKMILDAHGGTLPEDVHVTDAERASQFLSPSDCDHPELTALFSAHRKSAEWEIAELKGTLMKAGPIQTGPIGGEHGRRYPQARQTVIEFEDGSSAYDLHAALVHLRIYFNED